MESIREFLEAEMGKRGWKQADLARASNLDSAVISNIINGRRKMGEETGRAIAHAFRIPVEEVFRAAGLLPPVSEENSKKEELNYLLNMLDDDDLQEIIKYARYRLEDKENKKQTSRKPPARRVLKEE
jgi:transcriptional regulator with XRE-family HTH domain